VKQQLSAGAQQTKIRHTSPSKIKDCIVWVPTLEEQKRIGNLLSSLDQKIALNRKINDNLEAMAKQLYDYWFVQFDFPNKEGKPYKSSGGKMVWNEKLKREIPEGWEVKDIKSFMRIFTGKKDVSKAIPGAFKFFSCAPEPITSNEYIYDGAAVLVSGNGSYTGRVTFYNGKMDLYQRTYACVMKNNEYTIPFFYYTLRYLFQPIFSGGKHGSSIPYIVLGDLADFLFAYKTEIVNKFVINITAMFNKRFSLLNEIETLTKQRDELLPLLMNGQVSVN
jgi:type I restriction enzyme S subunit